MKRDDMGTGFLVQSTGGALPYFATAIAGLKFAVVGGTVALGAFLASAWSAPPIS